MPAPYLFRPLQPFRRHPSRAFIRLAIASGTLVLLAGCGALPPAPLACRDPSDPAAPAARAHYNAVTDSVSMRPVEAGAWRENNERAGPGEKP